MAQDLQALIKSIEQNKIYVEAQIDRLRQYLDNDNMSKTVARLRLDALHKSYSDYAEGNKELTLLQNDHPLLNSFVDIEVNYFEVSAVVKDLEQENLNVSSHSIYNSTIMDRHEAPKLPKIKLPTFDGTHEKWLIFKNKFVALVHDRVDISDIVKFTQLENSLSGDALGKISEFTPSGENYSKAWQALLDSYDQKRMLVVEHLDAIFALPIIPKATVADLSILIDKTKQHLHMLNQLDVQFPDPIIVRILEQRLPPATRAKWEETLDLKKMPSLEQFYTFIQTTVFKLRSIQRIPLLNQGNTRKRTGEVVTQFQTKSSKMSGRSFLTASSSTSSAVPLSCLRCNEDHYLFKCLSFQKLSIQERWDFVKANKLCRNCLRTHQFPCKSGKRCKKCERNHHTLLHNDKMPQQSKAIQNLKMKDDKSSTSKSTSQS